LDGPLSSAKQAAIATLRAKLRQPGLLQAVAAHDAVSAKIAESVGFDAIVVGGGLTAGFQFGLPDTGVITGAELAAVGDRIARATSLPVLIDIDDGGPALAHVGRAVDLAARSEVAGVMIEDVDSTHTKVIRPRSGGGWDFSANRLHPIEGAVDRISAAVERRGTSDDLLVIARTDALHVGTSSGVEPALERARRFLNAGADLVLIAGATPALLTADVVASLGGPLMYAQAEHISAHDRAQLETAGCKIIFHWLIPFIAVFAAYREAVHGLHDGRTTQYADQPWDINRDVLALLDGGQKARRDP